MRAFGVDDLERVRRTEQREDRAGGGRDLIHKELREMGPMNALIRTRRGAKAPIISWKSKGISARRPAYSASRGM